MKILYIITKGNFGGAQRYVFNLATGLPSSSLSRGVLDKDIAVAFGEGEVLEQKLREKGIRTIRLENAQRNVNIFRDIKLFFELLKLFKKERPDIIHLNSSKVGLLGSLSARVAYILHPKPYTLIFTAHGWAFNDNRPWWQKKILKIIQWKTVILSHKTIAVSESVKKDFANWPFTDKKIEVIYNGIETTNFLSKEKAREKLLPEESKKFWIGTISELHTNKGLDILILGATPILKNNPNLILVILGEGEERDSLSKLIKSRDLEKQVFLLGYVKDASHFLKAFDIFTLTSRTEGLPYVLLEAGLAGVPIIASRVGGIPEIIENFGILVEKENTEELKQKLRGMIVTIEKSLEQAINLKKNCEQKFSLKRMMGQTFTLYNQIIQR